MDHSLSGLIHALVLAAGVIAALLLLWVLVSPLAFAVRAAGETIGIPRLLALVRVVGLRELFAWPGAWFGAVKTRLDPAVKKPVLRVVIDERLTHLKQSMIAVQSAIVSITDRVARLGTGGPAELHADIESLQTEIKQVAELGGEIPDGLLTTYQDRARSTVSLFIAAFLFVAFSIVNGILLNQFSQAMISTYTGPIPNSLMFSSGLVLFEAGTGFLVSMFSSKERGQTHAFARWLFIGAIAVFTLIECIIFGLMGRNFPLQTEGVSDLHIPPEWLGLLGLVFAPTTAGVGYVLHQLIDERAETTGARKLREDVQASNKFVKSLPQRWQEMQGHAQNAQAAIDGYAKSQGRRDAGDVGAGAINDLAGRLTTERAEFVGAIAAAKIDDWRTVLEASEGDDRRDGARNFFLMIGTAIGTTAAVLALTWLLEQGFDVVRWYNPAGHWVLTTPVPRLGWLCLSILVILVAYWSGFMCFGRLHNVDAANGRAFPLRTGRAESAVAIVLAVLIACGLLWTGMRAFGWLGLGVALLLAGGMVGIAWLGYHLERSARASVALVCLMAACVAGLVAGFVALAFNGAAWVIAVLFWSFWVVVRVLEAPTRVIVGAYKGRRALQAPTSHAPQLAT